MNEQYDSVDENTQLKKLVAKTDSLFSLCWHRGYTSNSAPIDLALEVGACLCELRSVSSKIGIED